MPDELIDQSQKEKPVDRVYTVLFRVLFLGGLFYVVKLFFDYYRVKESMDSPLLPSYAVNYIYGSSHAIHGLYAASALIIAYLIQWVGNTKIALIVMGLSIIGGVVLLSQFPLKFQ